METWEWTFVAAVMGVAAALFGYTGYRRVLHAAVDDRYGEWSRFRARADRLAAGRGRLQHELQYALAFFVCYGVTDLTRLVTLLLFDLVVVFALLSPFWRYVFFEDWNAAVAVAAALAGVSIYTFWGLRRGLKLCRVHTWSETGRCERCGESRAEGEDRGLDKKKGKGPGVRTAERGWSWHGMWERRLQQLTGRLEKETPEGPRPAG